MFSLWPWKYKNVLYDLESSVSKILSNYRTKSTTIENLIESKIRVSKGNTQNTPKFSTLWVPNPKIPMEFRHKPNPTHNQLGYYPWLPKYWVPNPRSSRDASVKAKLKRLQLISYSFLFPGPRQYKNVGVIGKVL